MNKHISKAISIVGGQTALAVELKIAPSNVAMWLNGARPVPVHHVKSIVRLTGGAVTEKQLRPNDWRKIWPELA